MPAKNRVMVRMFIIAAIQRNWLLAHCSASPDECMVHLVDAGKKTKVAKQRCRSPNKSKRPEAVARAG